MNKEFKPMLAAGFKNGTVQEQLSQLTYPLIASPKLDGIRCVIHKGQVLSRTLKPIPNQHIQDSLSAYGERIEGMDGELMVGKTFQDVTSSVMRKSGKPRFHFMVFDNFSFPNMNYIDRIVTYKRQCSALRSALVRPVPTRLVSSERELAEAIEEFLSEGYEGAIVRSPEGHYKFGRATLKQGTMIKLKPMMDDEARVIGIEEQMKNNNEKTINELGQSKRSGHKANKSGKNIMGKLVLYHETFGTFKIGTGFDDALRKEIWENQEDYLGLTVTFRYQAIGVKDKPRIPSFKGFRNKIDL